MSLELLLPVNKEAILGLSMLPKQVIGKNIDIHRLGRREIEEFIGAVRMFAAQLFLKIFEPRCEAFDFP